MADPREPWNIRPAKKRASVSASIKAEVEAAKVIALVDIVARRRRILADVLIKEIGERVFRDLSGGFVAFVIVLMRQIERVVG